MTDLIGATAFLPPSLKQQLLVFDRIAWPTTCWATPFARTREELERAQADRQFLLDRQIVFAPKVRVPFVATPPALIPGMDLDPERSWIVREDGSLEPMGVDLERRCDHAARIVAAYLRDVEQLDAVPITMRWTTPAHAGASTRVLQIVIKELPVPDDSHSIEDVLAFRDEMKQANLMQALRVWMNDVASGTARPSEIRDKIEYLIEEYVRELELHRMKKSTLELKRLVVTLPEVLESLLKFRWKDLTSLPFEFREERIELMEEERRLAGREVGYIVHAREKFGAAQR